MSQQLSDSFIADLNMTLRFYQNKAHTSKELEQLVDLSSHLIDAVGALRSYQVRKEKSGSFPSGRA